MKKKGKKIISRQPITETHIIMDVLLATLTEAEAFPCVQRAGSGAKRELELIALLVQQW